MGGRRWDRIKNEEIRRRASMEETLAKKVNRRVLRWFGRVERMDEGAGQESSRQLKWKVDRG